MVATMVAHDPMAEATPQEPLANYWFRPALLLVAGLLMALSQACPGDSTQFIRREKAWRSWACPEPFGFAQDRLAE